MPVFASTWEPTLLDESTVASGLWFYSDEIPYSASLVRQKYDYSSHDLSELEGILEIPYIDYIDYNISDKGEIYFWRFKDPNSSFSTESPTFSSYSAARDHIATYGKRFEITW